MLRRECFIHKTRNPWETYPPESAGVGSGNVMKSKPKYPRTSLVAEKSLQFWWTASLQGITRQWASCQICKTVGAHAPGMPGTFSPQARVSDPDMHHDTCVTHVPWCMPGSLNSGFLWSLWRGNVPGIPSACATRNVTYLVIGPCGECHSSLQVMAPYCRSFCD